MSHLTYRTWVPEHYEHLVETIAQQTCSVSTARISARIVELAERNCRCNRWRHRFDPSGWASDTIMV